MIVDQFFRVARLIARVRAAADERPLRRLAELEGAVVALGAPHVENRGRLVIGSGCQIGSRPVQTHLVVHRGATLRIGRDVQLAHGCGIACHSVIQIGDGSSLGAFTMVLDSDYHVPGDPLARAVPLAIEIGRNVRIGSHVTVLRGSHIGDGAIVEPGTVVSGEIPAGARVRGVPAQLVDERAGEARTHEDKTVSARVLRAAMRAFRLKAAPSLSDGPSQIAAWNSLGALSLLVAIEEEFGLALGEQEVKSVRRLEDLVTLLSRITTRTAA